LQDDTRSVQHQIKADFVAVNTVVSFRTPFTWILKKETGK
jgi:hypothetical protein